MHVIRRGTARNWFAPACLAILCAALVGGCASHSQDLSVVREALVRGAPSDALTKFTEKKEKPDDLLYLLERGYLEYEAGHYEASNTAFDAAELRSADLYTKSVTNEIASLITSDKVLPYRSYPYELVMIQYYRALNYLALGQHEDALVEARKANQRLTELADEKEDKNTYRDDAFLQYFTGLLYEDAGEWNDAAVAYRDAYEGYGHYTSLFGAAMPPTLPADLYRALGRIGADDEAKKLAEDNTDLSDQAMRGRDDNVVVFVEFGFAPFFEPVDIVLPIFDEKDDEKYKDCDDCEEKYAGVLVHRYGSDIYAYSGSRYTLDHVLRFAFPQVVNYPYTGVQAEITAPLDESIPTRPAEPLGAIMHKTFNERIPKILLKTVGRALVKEFARTRAKKSDATLGALINIVNVATEQADTRSWLFLPDRISMVKLALPSGPQKLRIDFKGPGGAVVETQTVNLTVDENHTTFVRVRSYR